MIPSTCRTLGALALAAALCPATADAQTVARSFDELRSLVKPGQTVHVFDTTGREVDGQIIELLQVPASGWLEMTEPDVRRMRLRGNAVKKGVLSELVVGAGVGWPIAFSREVDVETVGALPASTFAQSSTEHPFHKWDTAGEIGIRFGEKDILEWGAELGRYWTEHLKTSILLSRADDPHLQFVSFPNGFQDIQTAIRPIVLSGMVTYQFRENVFIHPYVSGGIRLAWLQDTTETYQNPNPSYATVPCGPTGTLSCIMVFPPVLIASETSPTRLDARPVAGGGAKVYFAKNRAFMRPELLFFVDPHGTARGMWRVLVGADF